MTDRERWTVYPLLFLALGIALKDKLTKVVAVKEVRCESIYCTTLEATDPKTRELISLAKGEVHCRGMACQELLVADPKTKQQVRAVGGEIACRDLRAPAVFCNALQVLDAQGAEAVQVAANAEGGFVTLTGAKNKVKTYLGNTEQFAGLLFFDQKGQPHLGTAFPLPLSGQQPQGGMKEGAPPAESPPTPEPEPE